MWFLQIASFRQRIEYVVSALIFVEAGRSDRQRRQSARPSRQTGSGFQQHAVLQRLVPTLDLALRLQVEWSVANVFHLLLFHSFSQTATIVARTVMDQRSRLVLNDCWITF